MYTSSASSRSSRSSQAYSAADRNIPAHSGERQDHRPYMGRLGHSSVVLSVGEAATPKPSGRDAPGRSSRSYAARRPEEASANLLASDAAVGGGTTLRRIMTVARIVIAFALPVILFLLFSAPIDVSEALSGDVELAAMPTDFADVDFSTVESLLRTGKALRVTGTGFFLGLVDEGIMLATSKDGHVALATYRKGELASVSYHGEAPYRMRVVLRTWAMLLGAGSFFWGILLCFAAVSNQARA